jgi:hypothetical protein
MVFPPPEAACWGGGGLGLSSVDSDSYVAANFLLLIAGIAVAGFVLWLGFFRHESPERRMAGYAVVFVGFTLVIMLINRTVF